MNSKEIIFINLWGKGGMKHYSDAYARVLVDAGYRVRYLTNYPVSFPGTHRPITSFVDYLRFVGYLLKKRGAHVHLNSGYPWLLPFYPIFLFSKSSITLHDARPHQGESRYKRMYFRINMLASFFCFKKIVVHSKEIRKELPRYMQQKTICIIPHVRLSSFAEGVPSDKQQDCLRILFFGRILAYKGLQYLLDALRMLPPDRYRLIIAGEGSLADYTMYGMENIEVKNKFIPDAELPFLFKSIDVVALPYVAASQSGVAELSLSFQKPVIATNVGAIPEVIDHKGNGYLVQPQSAEELKTALEFFQDDMQYATIMRRITRDRKQTGEDAEFLSAVANVYE